LCFHCEKIAGDAAGGVNLERPIVHAFMALVAKRFSEKVGLDLGPDDIKVTFEVVAQANAAHVRKQIAEGMASPTISHEEVVERFRDLLAEAPITARGGTASVDLPGLTISCTAEMDPEEHAETLAFLAEQDASNAAFLADLRAKGQHIIEPKDAGTFLRVLEVMRDLWRTSEEMLAWLNFPHPHLGGETPMTIIEQGRGQAVITLLENMRDGIPS
jgi:hypothetical protein